MHLSFAVDVAVALDEALLNFLIHILILIGLRYGFHGDWDNFHDALGAGSHIHVQIGQAAQIIGTRVQGAGQ